MGLDVGRWWRGGRLALRRLRHSLHLDPSLSHKEVVDRAIARLKVRLQAQALGQQHANSVSLFQPYLVIGKLGQPGISGFVRSGLDVVERVRRPVRCPDNWGVEAVCNLQESLDGKVRGFETARVRRT